MGLAQVVTLSVDDSTIAENGTATITATLNSSQGTETVVSFSILGTSTLGTDYSVSYTGKNSVKLVKDGLGQAYSIAIDKNGDLYIVEKEPLPILFLSTIYSLILNVELLNISIY